MKHFFNSDQEKEIIAAIREAEKRTSGEIKVRVEHRCNGNVMERATEVFSELNMQNTQLRNGVLIYIATENHAFAIIGDEGINTVAPEGFWDKTTRLMEQYFKTGLFVDGLCEGIRMVGQTLTTLFPAHREGEDVNELPDEISAE